MLFTRSLSTLAISLSLAIPALAQNTPPAPPEPAAPQDGTQTPPGEQDRWGAWYQLLNSSPIRVELNLTEQQKQELHKLMRMVREDAQKVQQRIPSEQQRQLAMQLVRQQVGTAFQRYSDQVQRILTPEQSARLNKLALQIRGPSALLDPQIAASLNLTAGQQQQIRARLDKEEEQQKQLRRDTRGQGKAGRKERRAGRQELKEQLDTDIRAVLTPEQQKNYDAMRDSGTDVRKLDPTLDTPQSIDLGTPEKIEVEVPQTSKPE